jgi:hypothetical protein
MVIASHIAQCLLSRAHQQFDSVTIISPSFGSLVSLATKEWWMGWSHLSSRTEVNILKRFVMFMNRKCPHLIPLNNKYSSVFVMRVWIICVFVFPLRNCLQVDVFLCFSSSRSRIG